MTRRMSCHEPSNRTHVSARALDKSGFHSVRGSLGILGTLLVDQLLFAGVELVLEPFKDRGVHLGDAALG